MYDQTQSHQPSGMGGMNSGQGFGVGGMDSGQSDEANASRRLRVRVAGTALFTVGLAAMGYSMVDKSMDNGESGTANGDSTKLEVNPNVKSELPKNDMDYISDPNLERLGNTIPTPPVPTPPTPPSPKPEPTTPVHNHEITGPHGLHDFSSCGGFAQAFAHARAELGGPGEIFIYHGKPYTTTYKHEADAGSGKAHLDRGFEVEMVVQEFGDGSKIIASDSDHDGKADKWYIETNETRSELIDTDGDGKFDSYMDSNGQMNELANPFEQEENEMPQSPVYDVITVDGVEFLAYGQDGQYDKLVGEYEGQILYYEDQDGDGSFEHAAILDENFQPIKEWKISPVSIEDLDVKVPDVADTSANINSTEAEIDSSLIGPQEEPIIDENDEQALNDDPYRIDAQEEIISGDLNNHADMSAFGH